MNGLGHAADAANVASHLPVMAEKHPESAAVIVQRRRGGHISYRTWTLAALEAESNALAHGLADAGITRGIRVVLMVTPGWDFFALTFALFKTGAVPVVVDPGMGLTNLKRCLDEAAPFAFIGISKAHVARSLFGWCPTAKTLITAGTRLFWGGTTLHRLRRPGSPFTPVPVTEDETAAILFTSGNTGPPKGAVYTHGVFNAQIRILKEDYGIAPGERDLSTFPLFALYGPALGMTSIIPDMDASRPGKADPRNLVAAIQDQQATNLFASPALIEVIGRYGAAHSMRLSTLRRVVSAGAPADIASLKRFQRLLEPGTKVIPSYGATEALPVTAITTDELFETEAATEGGAGICVGRPVTDVQLRTLTITDAPLKNMDESIVAASGTLGEIAVRGPVVTRSYFERPEATALAKIADMGGGFWHRMGDVGYIDSRGRLWMCGRKSHRVQTEVETLHTLPCERVFNTHPAVRRSALVGVGPPGRQKPVLCVELEVGARMKKRRIREELLEIGQRHSHTAAIREILFHRRFPTDVRHNAKIFRERLAIWAARKLR